MNTHTETSSELGAIRHRKKTSVSTIPLRHRGQQSQAHSFFSWALGLRTTTFSADTVTNSQPQNYIWIRQCFKNNTVINNNNKTVLAVVVIKFSPDSFLFGFTFFFSTAQPVLTVHSLTFDSHKCNKQHSCIMQDQHTPSAISSQICRDHDLNADFVSHLTA